jgi:hypothetical protein
MRTNCLYLLLAVCLSLAAAGDLLSEPQLVSCGHQLRTIGLALDMYQTNHGHYPKSLRALAPAYLKKLPVCPAAGADSYSKSYHVDPKTGYQFCCQGSFHKAAGLTANQPNFSRASGLGPSGLSERMARYKSPFPDRPLTRCKRNILKLATALEDYATDHRGKYPSSLNNLKPRYLKEMPTCLGSDSYSATYQVRVRPDDYSFYCKGEHHIIEGGQPNRPSFNSQTGLDD